MPGLRAVSGWMPDAPPPPTGQRPPRKPARRALRLRRAQEKDNRHELLRLLQDGQPLQGNREGQAGGAGRADQGGGDAQHRRRRDGPRQLEAASGNLPDRQVAGGPAPRGGVLRRALRPRQVDLRRRRGAPRPVHDLPGPQGHPQDVPLHRLQRGDPQPGRQAGRGPRTAARRIQQAEHHRQAPPARPQGAALKHRRRPLPNGVAGAAPLAAGQAAPGS
ncbi:hypothetical protein OF001_U130052 [Pseudomonas sp. OF001]|nr:hypothetical protein OF001_U130052 [Pseudomonas sp. OF001]